jgi:hypothetical protein
MVLLINEDVVLLPILSFGVYHLNEMPEDINFHYFFYNGASDHKGLQTKTMLDMFWENK